MRTAWLIPLLLVLPAAAQDEVDSVVATDSVSMTLDSGVWVDAGVFDAEQEAEEAGIPYEQWKAVSDDTIPLDRRHFDTAAVAALLQDPELDYDRVIERNQLWWERFLRWLNNKLNDLFGSRAGTKVFSNLHWFILGIAVLILAWFFRRHLLGSVFAIGAKQARSVTEIEEDIEKLDLPALLAEAERQHNWRLAIRYHWLSVLKRLVNEGRIRWQPRYTDADYLAQLQDPALRASFSELSFLFKWVWYGDAPMDRERYEHLRGAFIALHRPATTAP